MTGHGELEIERLDVTRRSGFRISRRTLLPAAPLPDRPIGSRGIPPEGAFCLG